jgi:hypothetical protein
MKIHEAAMPAPVGPKTSHSNVDFVKFDLKAFP